MRKQIKTAPQTFQKQLKDAFEDFPPKAPLLLHTNLLRIGIIGEIKSRDDMLKAHLHGLLQALGEEREIIIPTFNYDFPKTRVYDTLNDPCQVGTLNEYIRRQFPKERTLTPIFNFVVLNRKRFALRASENILGKESVFSKLLEYGGWVGSYGAHFSESSTFLHYIEERAAVPYRYIKRFQGVVIHPAGKINLEIQYRVKPLQVLIEYDLEKVRNELERNGLLTCRPLGNGKAIRCDASLATHYLLERLSDDPFFMLTQRSEREARREIERLGERMTFENMES